ncbi:hypothetical protein HN803_00110 [candidate division WWE3 bacterium]|nr:hypothetical protein [Candidatus Scalindua sp.]MBT7349188.1 hypothetical protein [candidate division WWE3 bacterium]
MPCKICPECNEGGMGVRTLKCKKCGHVFMKGKNETPKKPMKIKFEASVFDDEEQDEKVEDFSRKNKATKKYTLQLDDEEKLTVEKLAKNCKPFNHSIDDDGKFTMYGSVYIVDRGMDDCTHKRKPILPCHGVFAKIVADPTDGTLAIWVLQEDGEPDRIYLNAVA